MVVTKGGDGTLTDGEVPLQPKGQEAEFNGAKPAPDAAEISLGKRFSTEDGKVSVLVTKAGACDLRYDGQVMEMQQPRKLPSSD